MRHAVGPVEDLPRLRLSGRLGGVLRPAARHGDYLSALELLSSLRLCSNVPAQWAVQTALGGYQSIRELVRPGGRLYESRRAIIEAVQASRYLRLARPDGAMYAFIGVDPQALPDFDDQQFALDLLEQKHVLVAPGVSFNVPYRNHFRVTTPAGRGNPARGAGPHRRAAGRAGLAPYREAPLDRGPRRRRVLKNIYNTKIN